MENNGPEMKSGSTVVVFTISLSLSELQNSYFTGKLFEVPNNSGATHVVHLVVSTPEL